MQWFNVQPQPGELNEFYFRDHKGQSILEQQVKNGVKVAAMVLGTPEWAAETPGLKRYLLPFSNLPLLRRSFSAAVDLLACLRILGSRLL